MNEYTNREYLPSILENPDIQELVEFRKIQPEDYTILENLSQFTKTELISNFHNYFLNTKERCVEDLQNQIIDLERRLDSEPQNEPLRRVIEMSRWYLEVCRKYDWATANNINRVLERN